MNSLQCKGFRLRRPSCHLAWPPHPASFGSRMASAAAGQSELRAHWRSIGKDVPLFAINAEDVDRVTIWTPGTLVDLMDPVYDFVELEDA